MNASRSTFWPPPVDLYGLGLLRLVAKHGSITKACMEAGLTQSALTRQVQGMESRLGVDLFERTTRKLQLTSAGASLLKDTAGITGLMQQALQRIQSEQLDAPKSVRIGVSRSIAFGHLPGLLHAHLRRAPDARTSVEHLPNSDLLARLERNELDVAVMCPPSKLPSFVKVTHQMADGFHCIAPETTQPPKFSLKNKSWTTKIRSWLEQQNWILLEGKTQTGGELRDWLSAHSVAASPSMEPDNFDLIVHLVALGLGVSIVPRRAIAAFPRRQLLRRIPLPDEFSRNLVVVVPKRTKTPDHVAGFVENILFS